MHGHLLAGFDGSQVSAAAARWAADEAERRHAGLTILGCYAVPIITDYGMGAAVVAADLDEIAGRTDDASVTVTGTFEGQGVAAEV